MLCCAFVSGHTNLRRRVIPTRRKTARNSSFVILSAASETHIHTHTTHTTTQDTIDSLGEEREHVTSWTCECAYVELDGGEDLEELLQPAEGRSLRGHGIGSRELRH